MAGLLAALFGDQRTKYAPIKTAEYDVRPLALAAAADDAKQNGGKIYSLGPTKSMAPTFDNDDYLVGVAKPYDELKEGDVVNYRPKWNDGKLTCHRLVAKDKDGWIASGDNNGRSENWERVRPENYVDVVVSVHRTKKQPKK